MKTVLIALLLQSSFAQTFSQVSTQPMLTPISLSVCGSSAVAVEMAQAVFPVDGESNRQSALQMSVTFSSDGSAVLQSKGSERSLPTNVLGMKLPALCELEAHRQSGKGEVFSPGTPIPGIDLLAVASVLRFRAMHPWPGPGSGSRTDDPQTAIYMQSRGPYTIVYFVDAQESSQGWCAGQENYRYSNATGAVAAFDDCGEGHKAFLPALGRLPDQ